MLYTLQYGLHDFHGFRANTDFLSGREFWIQSKKKEKEEDLKIIWVQKIYLIYVITYSIF